MLQSLAENSLPCKNFMPAPLRLFQMAWDFNACKANSEFKIYRGTGFSCYFSSMCFNFYL